MDMANGRSWRMLCGQSGGGHVNRFVATRE
jgi:hypothetical protein